MSVPVENIVAKKGDPVDIPLTMYDGLGVPLNLTDREVNFRVWEEGEDDDLVGPVEVILSETPEDGSVRILVQPEEFEDLEESGHRYWFDVKIVDGPTGVQGRFYLEGSRVR